MKPKSFPILYFLILFLALILSIVFWMIALGFNRTEVTTSVRSQGNHVLKFTGSNNTGNGNWNATYLPVNPGQITTIDTSKIIIDSASQRKIISNLVNIAVKNATNSIADFAKDFKENYPSSDYTIVYIDSVINRVQVQLPEELRIDFKNELKTKLPKYKLLVWDEVLFERANTFNDPQLADPMEGWYLKSIHIDKAWAQSTGDKDVVIAVIDNGFDLTHPELKSKAIKPYNVIDKSNDVTASSLNHGTHVSSTIVATGNNGQGLVGVCPECSFMPIKVEDKNGLMSNSYVIDAILYAIKNKAAVINLSVGQQIPAGVNLTLQEQKMFINSGAKDEEEFWGDLFKYADERNVTCVLAAGNTSILTGFDPFQRSHGTIKVGATDKNFSKASFSNFGDLTTLFAPGTGIYGAKPGNSYEMLDGTSMAAPIVSGFVGLIKSKNKSITNAGIIKILTANSSIRNNVRILDIIGNIY